jgi:hypothetical protein
MLTLRAGPIFHRVGTSMPIQFIPPGILEKLNFNRDLEGVRSLGAAEPDGAMFRSRGCKGLQPSKSIAAIEALVSPWRAARSLGAAEPDGTMFCCRDCKGLQPSKSIAAIEVLIGTWRAPGPSAPPNPMGQCSAAAAARDAALQVNNDHRMV